MQRFEPDSINSINTDGIIEDHFEHQEYHQQPNILKWSQNNQKRILCFFPA